MPHQHRLIDRIVLAVPAPPGCSAPAPALARAAPMRRAAGGVVGQPAQRRRQRRDIALGVDQPALADYARDLARRGADHRHAAAHCLDQHAAKLLLPGGRAVRGQRQHIELAQLGRHVVGPGDQLDLGRHAQLSGARLDLRPQHALAHQPQPHMRRQQRQRLDQVEHALLRHQPAQVAHYEMTTNDRRLTTDD